MLKVATETLSLESGPGSELVHGVGLGGPAWKAVGVEWEGLLLCLVDGAVVEEEDGAICGFEPMWLSVSALSFQCSSGNVHLHLSVGSLPPLSWDNWLQNILVQIPKLVVLGTSEEDDAGGLGVEGGWDVLDDSGEDLLDALV